MAELGWAVSEVTQEHLQNLVSQGYMTAAELATCCVSEDAGSPAPARDTSWHARHSMSKDLVWHHTNFSALCYSSMAWSYIT
jgi:hypothetical protein